MISQDSDLIDLNSREGRELWLEAYARGIRMAEGTISWLKIWWTHKNFPVDPETGAFQTSRDLLLHAGAVTSIWHWQADGHEQRIGPHVHTLGDMVAGFTRRVLADPSGGTSTEGATLQSAISEFEFAHRVPASYGRLDVDATVVMVVNKLDDDGIDSLAKLLLDFSHL